MRARAAPNVGVVGEVIWAAKPTASTVEDDSTHVDRPPSYSSARKLMRAMERVQAQPSVALKVVWACDDPRSSARSVGEACEADPVLTARLLRMANSTFYAPRSPVANGHRAVAVLGFSTVKALALLATGGSSLNAVPDGFWEHSAEVSVAARLLAPRYNVTADDAFAAGLLHEIGIALLHDASRSTWAEVAAAGAGPAAESELFGIEHGQAAAEVFLAWRLPPTLLDAVASHNHPPIGRTTPLAMAVMAGDGLIETVLGGWHHCPNPSAREVFERLELRDDEVQRITETVLTGAADLRGALTG